MTFSSTGTRSWTAEILELVKSTQRVLEDRLLALGVGHEVRREVALVELHALGELELDAEGVGLLDGDGAVLADLVDRLGDDVADRRVGGGDASRPGRSGSCRRPPGPASRSTSTTAATAFSMPRLSPAGLAPAATLRRPSLMSAWASTVAVVVPSPATSLVLVATSLTSCAPMFSNGSSSSISRAIDTPSLVIVGRAELLADDDVAALGPQGHLDRVGELVDAGLEAATGLLVELQ